MQIENVELGCEMGAGKEKLPGERQVADEKDSSTSINFNDHKFDVIVADVQALI